MNIFSKFAIAALITSGTLIHAAEVIDFTSPENSKKITGNGSVVYAGNQIQISNGRAHITSKQTLQLDPAKKYTVDVTVVNTSEKKSMLYVGFNPATADGKIPPTEAWQANIATFTQLSRDAKKGDKVIYVKNGAKWKAYPHSRIIINALEDNSDIPNINSVASSVTKIENLGSEWAIHFKTPLKIDIAANSNVRQHSSGGYMYVFARALNPGEEISINHTVSGFLKNPGHYHSSRWPFGAEKAYFIILGDWSNQKAGITVKKATLTIE